MTSKEYLARRQFLKELSSASAAALACGGVTALNATQGAQHPEAKADSCILIWMAGGMAAPDTFDPKAYSPFEKGSFSLSPFLSSKKSGRSILI